MHMLYPGLYFDPLYLLFALPALLLGLYAQMRVSGALNRYSKVRAGMTGAQVARRLLDGEGLYDVTVEEVRGFLSDHYDPRSRTLRLSPKVARTDSLAAVGVAAHEAGHALQHAAAYWPLQVRSAMVPTVQFGSWLGPIIFFLGLMMNLTSIAWLGVLLFGGVALFSLATLPVELDASRRAKALLRQRFMVDSQGMMGISKVLNAAALTYVAAAIQAVSTLLYYVFLLSGSRRRD